MDVLIQFELSSDVSEASRYSLAAQLAEVIEKALEEMEIDLPDGEIEDFHVIYDEQEYM